MAWVVAALVLVIVDTVSITMKIDMPAEGVSLRLTHLSCDALGTLMFGTLAGLVGAAVVSLPRLPRWVVFAASVAIGIAVSHWILGDAPVRPTIKTIGWTGLRTDGLARALLHAGFLGAIGTTLALAPTLERGCVSRPRLALVATATGVGALALNAAVLQDEYQEMHTVAAWLAARLVAAGVARLTIRLRALTSHPIWFSLPLLIGYATLATPRDRIRRELAKDPSSASAHLMAQALWHPTRVPTVMQAAALARAASTAMHSPPGPSQLAPPNTVVLLVTVDALRADIVNSGEHDAALPHLSRLREEGAWFSSAIAAASQTTASLTTVFSGHYASQLFWDYVRHDGRRGVYPAGDTTVRFTERLAASGIRTVAVVSPWMLGATQGVLRGFEEHVVRRRHAHAHQIVPTMLDKLATHGDGPGFFYIHLMEPHHPYDRSDAAGSAFERYLGEVALVDRWIGELATTVRTHFPKRGYLIIAADHGEAFGEHGTTLHSKTVYEELVHVPLVVWGPDVEPRRIDDRVGLVDIGPTILQLFDETRSGVGEWPTMGDSLLPSLAGRDRVRRHPLGAEARLRRSLYSAIGLKIIEDTRRKYVEAYDLAGDPGELHDVFSATDPRSLAALAELRAFYELHAARAPGYVQRYKR